MNRFFDMSACRISPAMGKVLANMADDMFAFNARNGSSHRPAWLPQCGGTLVIPAPSAPAMAKLAGRFRGLTQLEVFYVKDIVLIDPIMWGSTLGKMQIPCPKCTATGVGGRNLTSNGEYLQWGEIYQMHWDAREMSMT